MKKLHIRKYIRQILAITEKDIFLKLRVKSSFVFRFLNPSIELILLLFLFGAIFNTSNINFAYWNTSNYTLFLLIAYIVQYSKSITNVYDNMFKTEKYWKALSGVLTAPINRYVLLMGTLIGEVLLNGAPLLILIILAYILYPIHLFNLFIFLLLLSFIFLIFGAIGLIIGVFRISFEELSPYAKIFLKFVFLLSCLNYPLLIFPQFVRIFILINPLYYFFDLLRLVWLSGFNFSLAISYLHPIHIIVAISITLSAPIISVFIFNQMYKKYGITGY